jgi:hypothetical protein
VLIQAGQAHADLEVLWSHEGDVPGCNTVGAVSADGRAVARLHVDDRCWPPNTAWWTA